MRSPGTAFDLRAALTQELRTAAEELENGGKPKSIHRARVGIKRARALARVGRTCAPGLSDVFNGSARTVMHVLAQARDLAALAEAARNTSGHASEKEAAALNAIADALDAERLAKPAPDLETARAGLRDLLALAQVWPEASHSQIKRGALRLVRRARRARRQAEADLQPDARHAWRKREKDRLHGALLLDKSWPRDRRRKQGQKLGDILGDERDAMLLVDRLQADPALAGDDKAAKRALKALERRQRKLAARADKIGARLHAEGA